LEIEKTGHMAGFLLANSLFPEFKVLDFETRHSSLKMPVRSFDGP
tara:strand:+ start:403 stop:537 length:135 start_codon:yes stop_codon:yes gene_type:complete